MSTRRGHIHVWSHKAKYRYIQHGNIDIFHFHYVLFAIKSLSCLSVVSQNVAPVVIVLTGCVWFKFKGSEIRLWLSLISLGWWFGYTDSFSSYGRHSSTGGWDKVRQSQKVKCHTAEQKRNMGALFQVGSNFELWERSDTKRDLNM